MVWVEEDIVKRGKRVGRVVHSSPAFVTSGRRIMGPLFLFLTAGIKR